jgi:hypothetical protein
MTEDMIKMLPLWAVTVMQVGAKFKFGQDHNTLGIFWWCPSFHWRFQEA